MGMTYTCITQISWNYTKQWNSKLLEGLFFPIIFVLITDMFFNKIVGNMFMFAKGKIRFLTDCLLKIV